MGVGNEFRRDDGVGPFIVQKLRAEKWSIQNLSLECCQGFSLIESWKGATMAVVLDAVISGAVPGKIYRFEAHAQSLPRQFFKCSTHNLGVAEAIELGRALNQLPRYLIVYGIEGKSFDQGVGLSSEVEKAAKEVVESVFRDIMG
jgi:hydrogenase maturation protease